jgi:activating signal cointegrator 1
MKALTLTQPWASLVAIGAKRIETRSWRTPYRGPLAIHAAKGFPQDAKRLVTQDWTFFTAFSPGHSALLRESGVRLIPSESGYGVLGTLPLGAVIATCRLVSCIPTRELQENRTIDLDPDAGADSFVLDVRERKFGDYTPGRWAWLLADIRLLPEPIPATGRLSLWELDDSYVKAAV